MKKKWTLQTLFSGMSFLVDGSVSLRFQSIKDLTDDDKLVLISSHNASGHLAFSEDEIKPEDIPAGETDGGKSPSQRLRAVIFIYWKQQGSVGDFDVYYRQEIEKGINHYKSKLDD
jgi:hypothetical protein